jgi:hypothetical protein
MLLIATVLLAGCYQIDRSDEKLLIFTKLIAKNVYSDINRKNIVGYGFIEQNELVKKIDPQLTEFNWVLEHFYDYIDQIRGEPLLGDNVIAVSYVYSKNYMNNFVQIGWYRDGIKNRIFFTGTAILDGKNHYFYILLKNPGKINGYEIMSTYSKG